MSQRLTRRVCYAFNSTADPGGVHPWHLWRTFGPTEVAGIYNPCVLFTNTDDAAVPAGFIEVQRGERLPVSAEERQAVNSVAGLRRSTTVRQHRQDPGTHDPLVWVAPLTETAATAREHWLAAGDGAIGTEHSHVALELQNAQPQHGRWQAWCGLGLYRRRVVRGLAGLTQREAALAGVGLNGNLFTDRGTALRCALDMIRGLRAEAVQRLESALAGWSREAIDARLNPSREMRVCRGWEPLLPKIQIRELVLEPSRRAGWHDDRWIVVEEIAIDDLADHGALGLTLRSDQTAAA